ncbi:hypothetical protein [Cellulosimicrobium sp. TH-20]|uniref:hypothetical protein n=1 Tax=Cellulosimicrobium sp. TH-20 TaxID=1980001 RepID=UPI0011A11B01|nr:hypothetical protein [Cellulosimicrobium sp. TH-20]
MTRMETRPLAIVRADIVKALRALAHPEEGVDVTSLRRAAARALIEARAHFIKSDGNVDWSGRTFAYREFSREVFQEAGISRDEAPTIQAAIRYHSGNLIREVVPEDELVSAGFALQESPRERSAHRRAERTDDIRLLESGAPLEGEELVRALLLASSVTARASSEALRRLPAKTRREATDVLARIASDLRRLGFSAGEE